MKKSFIFIVVIVAAMAFIPLSFAAPLMPLIPLQGKLLDSLFLLQVNNASPDSQFFTNLVVGVDTDPNKGGLQKLNLPVDFLLPKDSGVSLHIQLTDVNGNPIKPGSNDFKYEIHGQNGVSGKKFIERFIFTDNFGSGYFP